MLELEKIFYFSMINYRQASNKIDSQLYMEQLLKSENSLRTTGFDLVPSDCEQEVRSTYRQHAKEQASEKCSHAGDNLQFVMEQFAFDICPEKRSSACRLSQSFLYQL